MKAVTLAGYVANENQRSSSCCDYAKENHEKGCYPFHGGCEENGHFDSPLSILLSREASNVQGSLLWMCANN
jgi:hypothetical protein